MKKLVLTSIKTNSLSTANFFDTTLYNNQHFFMSHEDGQATFIRPYGDLFVIEKATVTTDNNIVTVESNDSCLRFEAEDIVPLYLQVFGKYPECTSIQDKPVIYQNVMHGQKILESFEKEFTISKKGEYVIIEREILTPLGSNMLSQTRTREIKYEHIVSNADNKEALEAYVDLQDMISEGKACARYHYECSNKGAYSTSTLESYKHFHCLANEVFQIELLKKFIQQKIEA